MTRAWNETRAMLGQVLAEWSGDSAPRLGAALAYYTAFSLAPILTIVIAVAALVYGDEAARGRIVAQVDGLVGREAAEAIEAALRHSREPRTGLLATLIGLGTLLLGASGVVSELKSSLNRIWDVPPKEETWLAYLRSRALSLGFVVALGFLTLVSLTASAAIAAVTEYASASVAVPGLVLGLIELTVSLALYTVMFAGMFKFLPDVEVAWRDVWIGSLATAVLFAVGKQLIGLYLGRSGFTSTYGAAGSVLIILAWDLLLGPDRLPRRRVHPGLREPLRLAHPPRRGLRPARHRPRPRTVRAPCHPSAGWSQRRERGTLYERRSRTRNGAPCATRPAGQARATFRRRRPANFLLLHGGMVDGV